MQKISKEKKPLVFIDKTWTESNLTVIICWHSDEIFGVIKTVTAARLIIALCTIGKMGFMPNSFLTYKAKHYHKQSSLTEEFPNFWKVGEGEINSKSTKKFCY